MKILEREGVVIGDGLIACLKNTPFFISESKFGVKAIIQPGGSVKDQEIIEAAKEKDIAMVFTGRRHFRH